MAFITTSNNSIIRDKSLRNRAKSGQDSHRPAENGLITKPLYSELRSDFSLKNRVLTSSVFLHISLPWNSPNTFWICTEKAAWIVKCWSACKSREGFKTVLIVKLSHKYFLLRPQVFTLRKTDSRLKIASLFFNFCKRTIQTDATYFLLKQLILWACFKNNPDYYVLFKTLKKSGFSLSAYFPAMKLTKYLLNLY